MVQEEIPYTEEEVKAIIRQNEELRKKYNNALEKARELMDKGYYVLMPEIFPELQESKEEKASLDDKLYVQDKHGFIYELLHDWGDVVTVVTENGEHIDFLKDTITILDFKDVVNDTIRLLHTKY